MEAKNDKAYECLDEDIEIDINMNNNFVEVEYNN